MGIEVLEHARTIRFLIFLYKEDNVPVSHIRWQIKGGQKTIYGIIKRLKDAELIQEEKQEDFPWRRVIKLTEKGIQVAAKLEEIQKLIERKNS
ncbi:MAG: MarR family transcriptional regulator [Candidatus Bathyarchaeales archaeon]